MMCGRKVYGRDLIILPCLPFWLSRVWFRFRFFLFFFHFFVAFFFAALLALLVVGGGVGCVFNQSQPQNDFLFLHFPSNKFDEVPT